MGTAAIWGDEHFTVQMGDVKFYMCKCLMPSNYALENGEDVLCVTSI